MAVSIDKFAEKTLFSRLMGNCEKAVLCFLLLAIIVLACTQITLRTFFSGGLVWADPVLRYLVLWTGLLGAVTATGQGKHIALDILGGRMPKTIVPYATLLSHLFSFLTASALAWASVIFFIGEMEFGGPGPLTVPLWVWNMIFPLAFGLLAVKYFFFLLMQAADLLFLRDEAERS